MVYIVCKHCIGMAFERIDLLGICLGIPLQYH